MAIVEVQLYLIREEIQLDKGKVACQLTLLPLDKYLGEIRFGHFSGTKIPRPYKVQGCHGQGKVREKRKFFKVREKSGNFLKGQGKSLILSKSVKSQGILFSGL